MMMSVLAVAHLLLLATIIPIATSSISAPEQRKQEYVSTVYDNYDKNVMETIGCDCGEKVITPEGEECSADGLIGTNFVANRDPGLIVWAYRGDADIATTASYDNIFCMVDCDKTTTSDFDLNLIVRMLYLAAANADTALVADIVRRLQDKYDARTLRLWITRGDNSNLYYTENHMILWLSSTLLLQPYLNVRPDDDAFLHVEARITQWLETRKSYGFYEFFSRNYYPFTLAALLNLVDFSAGVSPTIQSLAEEVTARILGDFLLFTTSEGHFYPVSGRGKNVNYLTPRFESTTYILTGNGVPLENDNWKSGSGYAGAFLATSGFDLAPILAANPSSVDRKLSIGHPTEEHQQVHSSMSRVDRTLFQWSAGDVLQPVVVDDSLYVAGQYLIPGPSWFPTILRLFLPLVGGVIRWTSKLFPGNLYGSSLTQTDVSVFKNGGVALASLNDYHPGARGNQQYPVMATVGDIAVWTQSVSDRCFVEGLVSNVHLPQISQDGNVALIVYRPITDVRLLSSLMSLFGVAFDTTVSLRFPEDRFDEVQEVDTRWIVGRQGPNYIAVWRHGLDVFDCSGIDRACEDHYFSNPRGSVRASSWVIVVGNSDMHGDFSNFVATISQGVVREELTTEGFILKRPKDYTAEVSVDGKTLRVVM